MKTMTPAQAEQQLTYVADRFDHWRQTRISRAASIPQSLWEQAIALTALFPLTRVAYWGPNTGKVNDAVSKAFERIFLGDQTVDEAFAQAQEEIQAALDGQ